MIRPSREEYNRAVRLALDAIEAHKNRPRVRADRHPKTLIAAMQEKLMKGETPTESDVGALAAAIAEQERPRQRGRGRPRGRDTAALEAFWTAAYAIQGIELAAYRNGYTGHGLTQCHAIAEAMHSAGFRTLLTYDAAEREMKNVRRKRRATRQLQNNLRGLAQTIERFQQQTQEMANGLSQSIETFQRQTQGIAIGLAQAYENVRLPMQQIQQNGRALAGAAQRMRAATTLSPHALHALERLIKTMG